MPDQSAQQPRRMWSDDADFTELQRQLLRKQDNVTEALSHLRDALLHGYEPADDAITFQHIRDAVRILERL